MALHPAAVEAREAFLALAPFATYEDAEAAATYEYDPPPCSMCDGYCGGEKGYGCYLERDDRYWHEVFEDERRVTGF